MAFNIRYAIKNGMSSNILIYDRVMKMYYKKYNRDIEACVSKLSKIDSIKDFPIFREEMLATSFPENSGTFTIKRAYSENTLYGYADSIMKYAGIDPNEILYLPLLLHGVPYVDDFDIDKFAFYNSFIFQGNHDALRVKENYPNKKIYTVGPYIYYTMSNYNKEDFDSFKKQLGKTALIFLNHTAEQILNHSKKQIKASMQVNKKIDYILSRTNKTYDTYIVCVYCQDVNQVSEKDMNEKNIMYVSAGYKLDNQFCSRIKTILELSDDIYFDGFSSSIGYAYIMKKNVYSLEENKNVGDSRIPENRYKKFSRLFGIGNQMSDNERSEYIDKYWGLSQIKTKKEIWNIFAENKERIRKRKGFFI